MKGAMTGSDWPRPRLLLLICAHVLALLAYPFAAGMLVNSLVGADLRYFGLWAGVLVCLPIAEALLYTAREADMDTWAEKVGADLRTRLLRHTLSLPLTYFHAAKSGQLVTRLTDNVREFADGRVLFADGIKHALTIVFALGLLTTGHGLLLALVTAAGCAYAVNAALLLPALRRHSARNLLALENLNEHLRERLHILPFTRFMGSARWEAEQFRRLSETEVRAAQSREALVKALIGSASALLQALSVGGIYAVGGYLLYRRAISLGELLMAAGYAARVSFASQQLVETAKKYQAAFVAGRNAREIFAAEPERWPGRRTPPDVVRSVEWRGVSFRYPGREWVLKDFSLRVEAGELAALVGPSGSGKSTALDILAGLLQPEEGAVIINDAIDLRELDVGAWRARVAYGTQFQFFFAGSLRQNLVYPSQDGQEQQLIELAGRLGLHREIVSRPGGYDAIQQIQKTFSGGQRQRLGLIRALLKPAPALVILDEPTAALDASAQALVMNIISPLKHGCPVLFTTHRPSTMTYADKVARLEGGRAVPR